MLRAQLDAKALREGMARLKSTGADVVRLTTTNHHLDLDASSFATYVATRIACRAEPGTCIVPAGFFGTNVEHADGEVALRAAHGALTLTAGRMEAEIRTLEPDSVVLRRPATPVDDLMRLTGDDLDALARLLPAASREQERPERTGVTMGPDGAMCTDTYRMHFTTSLSLPEMIVPANAFGQAVQSHVGLGLSVASSGELVLRTDDTLWQSRVIQGPRSEWRRLVDAEQEYEVTVDREALETALRVTGVTPVPGVRMRAVVFEPYEAGWLVRSWASEHGEVSMPVEVEHEVPPFRWSVASSYLADALKAVGGERVSIGMTTAMSPLVIRSNGPVGALVMPRLTHVNEAQ